MNPSWDTPVYVFLMLLGLVVYGVLLDKLSFSRVSKITLVFMIEGFVYGVILWLLFGYIAASPEMFILKLDDKGLTLPFTYLLTFIFYLVLWLTMVIIHNRRKSITKSSTK